MRVPVVQWIELHTPKVRIEVQFLAGTQKIELIYFLGFILFSKKKGVYSSAAERVPPFQEGPIV